MPWVLFEGGIRDSSIPRRFSRRQNLGHVIPSEVSATVLPSTRNPFQLVNECSWLLAKLHENLINLGTASLLRRDAVHQMVIEK